MGRYHKELDLIAPFPLLADEGENNRNVFARTVLRQDENQLLPGCATDKTDPGARDVCLCAGDICLCARDICLCARDICLCAKDICLCAPYSSMKKYLFLMFLRAKKYLKKTQLYEICSKTLLFRVFRFLKVHYNAIFEFYQNVV